MPDILSLLRALQLTWTALVLHLQFCSIGCTRWLTLEKVLAGAEALCLELLFLSLGLGLEKVDTGNVRNDENWNRMHIVAKTYPNVSIRGSA